MTETVYRQCTLCEAQCGIKVEVADGRVVKITGDPDVMLAEVDSCR